MNPRILTLLAVGLALSMMAPEAPQGPSKKDGDKVVAKSVKEAAPPREVEVHYGNGSRVITVLLEEKIEIVTEYGKLSIPPKDILGVDFGVHVPEGVAAKVADAIKQLSSNSFKQRETAVKDLIALGADAYPALHRALQGSETEVLQRVKQILKVIEQKCPPRTCAPRKTI
jgi:hypothetical protein